MNEERIDELEKKVLWNKRHLRIVFFISIAALLLILGHFALHASGTTPH